MLFINFYLLLVIGRGVKTIQYHLTYDGDKSGGDSRVTFYLSFVFFFQYCLSLYTSVIYLKILRP